MKKTDPPDEAETSFFMGYRGFFKKFYDKFISLQGEPREIAISTALGVFIGVTPTIPFHTVAITFLCLLFRQNLTAAILSATVISNPVTIPFFYYGQYELGRMLLGHEGLTVVFDDVSLAYLIDLGWHIFYPLQVGGLIIAGVFAIPAYFITHRAVHAVRSRYEKPEGHPEGTRPPAP